MSTRYLSILIALVATAPVMADDAMERAVETAARNFRIQTYEAFRTNRPVYDERIEAANEALRRFRLAADDVGRVEMQEWFFEAGSIQDGTLPIVPEIQVVESRDRLKRSGPTLGRSQVKPAKQNAQRKNGFVVTEYKSNPRFEKRRQLDDARQQESLVNSDANDSAITKALKNPGELFGNIGKSFLRGREEKNNDQDAAADNKAQANNDMQSNDDVADNEANDNDAEFSLADDDNSEYGTETIDVESIGDDDADMKNALDEIIASDSDQNDFGELNNRIVGQNLAIGLLAEDFHGDELKSLDFLNECVDRLEKLNTTQVEIKEQFNLFSDDQQNELTQLNSLEEVTTELMTSVNESATLLSAGEIEDEDGSIEEKIGDLRMRLSQILAEHSF